MNFQSLGIQCTLFFKKTYFFFIFSGKINLNVIEASNSLSITSISLITLVIIIVIIAVGISGVVLWKKKKNNQSLEQNSSIKEENEEMETM